MSSLWRIERRGPVVIARYDNPPMNYLTTQALHQLRDLTNDWSGDDVWVVILAGALESRFITHFSVEEYLELSGDREDVIASGTSHTEAAHAARQALNNLRVPVIAALNGDTMGGGLEVALACDIRIGEPGDFRYGLPEVRLGLLPGGSGTQRLARLIGLGRAIDFVLRGRIVPPEEALEIGLVHEIADSALSRAIEIAEDLSTLSRTSLAMAKRALYEGSELPLAAGLRVEAEALFHVRLSAEARATMQAYTEIPFDERRDWLERRDVRRATRSGAVRDVRENSKG